jgi:nitronate monooxygenase
MHASLPQVIQGGMGIGVSGYRLARAVALAGGLGVVSGTAVDTVFVRRLGLGDPSGDLRRALAAFPYPAVAARAMDRYFVSGGKREGAAFRALAMPTLEMKPSRLELLVLANFVEVFLAKEGHTRPVGVNYLEKIQLPTLPSLLGALLAGVDYVLMGAGIPSAIPGVISSLARFEPAELKIDVAQNVAQARLCARLDPKELLGRPLAEIPEPRFLAIVSSHVVAKVLDKKASGPIAGFVVEDHTAGGHNAPPRKKGKHADDDAAFGPDDAPDLAGFRQIGRPFWLAGGMGSKTALQSALGQGASGVQIGTPFAFCEESGIDPMLKRKVLERVRLGGSRVVTDFEASPTGYPFKLVIGDGTELGALRARERVCDLGYLRQPYVTESGSVGYRCPGEPVARYVEKGGRVEATKNKLCLCNQLLATVGLGQVRRGVPELPALTAGESLDDILRFVPPGAASYKASDVMDCLLER